MNVSESHGTGAFFHDLSSGIGIHSQIAGSLLRIFCGLDGAERGFHFHIVTLLVNPGAMSYSPGEECDRSETENGHEGDHAHYDQNGLKGSAARSWCGRGTRSSGGNGRRRARGSRRDGRRSEYRRAALAAEPDSGSDARATRIAERHKSP